MAKRPRGRMTKEKQRVKDAETIREDLVDAVLKGDYKIVSNYSKYLDVMHDAATGKLNGVSPTNQISCAKTLKEYADAILKEHKSAQGGESSDTGGNTSKESTTVETTSLISLVPREEAS